MIDKFELLLELLDVDKKDLYVDIAKKIDSGKYKNIKTLHKHWFLFDAFNKFLNHEISLEDFVRVWDIDSNIKNTNSEADYELLLSENIDDLSNTLFVLSEIDFFWKFSKADMISLKNKFENIGSEIVLL